LAAWSDDWVIFERERIRQRLLHALETLSRRLAEIGRSADAVDAAMWAVSADPMRESANRVLIEAHLAEGNVIEARRIYRRYCDAIRREFGVDPSDQLVSLMRMRIRPQYRSCRKEAAAPA
jgi:DNA-binding SARP family transcriptional activator